MNKKILIVDDEIDILFLLKKKLENEGFQVITAVDGKDGVEKVRKENVDLIVLDIIMPVMNGFSMLKELRVSAKTKEIPVIILTARHAMKDTFEAMNVDCFFEKPYDVNELTGKIKFCLSNKILLLSDIPDTTEKISKILELRNYLVVNVKNCDEMLDKGKNGKYKAVIAHLACIDKEPHDFVLGIKDQCRSDPKLIIFSDSNVKDIGEDDSIAIQEIGIKWRRAGVKNFYDSRIEDFSFELFLKKLL